MNRSSLTRFAWLSIVASFVNLAVALVLRRAGKQYNSITLEANAQHLMTDVWTSAGVLVGIGAVALPTVAVFTHLESINNPVSWDDMALDRAVAPTPS